MPILHRYLSTAQRSLVLGPLVVLATGLSGCSNSFAPSIDPNAQSSFGTVQGRIFGGRTAIVGAHVFLFQAGTSGNAGPGIAASSANASVSRLISVTTGSFPTAQDTTNGSPTNGDYYVTTDAQGRFTLTGSYTCTPNSQVYIYAVGGKPDSVNTNASAANMAILGNCPAAGTLAAQTPTVYMNEISTVAAAYAMAGYATDATHVSSSGSALALTGIANAFANAANLYAIGAPANGTPGASALATTPAGNGTVPQTLINTLANILAACVNSTGANTCSNLFANASSNGGSGTAPTETATAAINIAHNPGNAVATLYNLQSALVPYSPNLGTPPSNGAPNDFTIGIAFSGGGINNTRSVAIDAAGNAWTINQGNDSITKLSPAGVPISGPGGYTDSTISSSQYLAIDTGGNVWIANIGTNSVTKLSNSGVALSGSGYKSGGISYPIGVAIDGLGDAWTANYGGSSLSELANNGTAISNSSGYTGGGITSPLSTAIDGAGSAWAANSNSTISKISSTGAPLSGSGGFTGGGLSGSQTIALDAQGNAWVGNYGNSSVSEFTNAGVAVSGASGFTGGGVYRPQAIAFDGNGSLWTANQNNSVSVLSNTGSPLSGSTGYTNSSLNTPAGIAVDGSGDVWIANQTNTLVTELIGAAAPVITPIAAGLPATPTGNGTSSLATRP